MDLQSIGNPDVVFKDINGHAVREGLWYTHPKHGAFKLMGLSDIKMDYQFLDMQNTNIYKVISGVNTLELFLEKCTCTGFIPNGKTVNPDLYDKVFDTNLSSYSTEELLAELLSRSGNRAIDELLHLYLIK